MRSVERGWYIGFCLYRASRDYYFVWYSEIGNACYDRDIYHFLAETVSE